MPSCSRGTGGTPGCWALLGVPGWRAVAPGTASLQIPVSARPGYGSTPSPAVWGQPARHPPVYCPRTVPMPGGLRERFCVAGVPWCRPSPCPASERPDSEPAGEEVALVTGSGRGPCWVPWGQRDVPGPLGPPGPASSPSPPPPPPQHGPHSLRSSSVLSRGSDADLPLVTAAGATLPRAGGLGSLRRARSCQHPAGSAAGPRLRQQSHGEKTGVFVTPGVVLLGGGHLKGPDPTLTASLGTPVCPLPTPPTARLLSPSRGPTALSGRAWVPLSCGEKPGPAVPPTPRALRPGGTRVLSPPAASWPGRSAGRPCPRGSCGTGAGSPPASATAATPRPAAPGWPGWGGQAR